MTCFDIELDNNAYHYNSDYDNYKPYKKHQILIRYKSVCSYHFYAPATFGLGGIIISITCK